MCVLIIGVYAEETMSAVCEEAINDREERVAETARVHQLAARALRAKNERELTT